MLKQRQHQECSDLPNGHEAGVPPKQGHVKAHERDAEGDSHNACGGNGRGGSEMVCAGCCWGSDLPAWRT